MDAFSEILSGVKLNGALFFSAEFSAPWCFASPASNTLAPLLSPGAPHLVIYHFVIDGAAFVQLPDGQSTRPRSSRRYSKSFQVALTDWSKPSYSNSIS